MSDNAATAILPADWTRARGFSHAVIARGSRVVSVAGQIAMPKGAGHVDPSHDFAQQWGIALGNVADLVKEAGGGPANITMLRAFVTSIDEYKAAIPNLGESWAQHMGKNFPAMTLVQVVGLVDPNAKVEIEAQAVLE